MTTQLTELRKHLSEDHGINCPRAVELRGPVAVQDWAEQQAARIQQDDQAEGVAAAAAEEEGLLEEVKELRTAHDVQRRTILQMIEEAEELELKLTAALARGALREAEAELAPDMLGEVHGEPPLEELDPVADAEELPPLAESFQAPEAESAAEALESGEPTSSEPA
jgi:hypothetical protein